MMSGNSCHQNKSYTFSGKELNEEAEKIKPKKAPGSDGVSPEVLK